MEAGHDIRWRMLTDDERAALLARAPVALSRFPWIDAAWLHGSVARADRPARDIDVALVVSRYPTMAELLAVAATLERETGLSEPPFDVRPANGADPVFLGRMLRDGQLLYERSARARVAFEVQALSQWLDFEPVWRRLRRRVLSSWARG